MKDIPASPIKVMFRFNPTTLHPLESIILCSDEVEPCRLEEAQGLRGWGRGGQQGEEGQAQSR